MPKPASTIEEAERRIIIREEREAEAEGSDDEDEEEAEDDDDDDENILNKTNDVDDVDATERIRRRFYGTAEMSAEEHVNRAGVRGVAAMERLLRDADSRIDEETKLQNSKFTSLLVALSRQLKRSRRTNGDYLQDIWIDSPAEYYAKLRPPLAIDVGHTIANAVWRRLKSFDLPNQAFRRTQPQSDMMSRLYGGCFRLFYGSLVYESNEPTILAQRGFKPQSTKQWNKFTTSRRFGKTWCISFYILALLLDVPNVAVAVFSPSQNQSNNVIGIIMKLAATFAPEIKFKVTKDKIVWRVSATDVRTVRAYAAGIDVSFSLFLPLIIIIIITDDQARE